MSELKPYSCGEEANSKKLDKAIKLLDSFCNSCHDGFGWSVTEHCEKNCRIGKALKALQEEICGECEDE